VIAFNQTNVAAEQFGTGVSRQRLLTDERVNGTKMRLDRIKLAPGASMQLHNSPTTLAWFQVLEGGVTFHAYYTDRMTEAHSAFLPPGFNATLLSDRGASLLYAEIPDIDRVHAGGVNSRPLFIVTEWEREPVLASEHDARKRIHLVAADMCETAAMQVEMVIYPSGSVAPDSHHEGADTFLYILTGRCTARAKGQEYSISQGDLVYFPDGERHSIKAAAGGDMRFLEFHVPAEFKTVWTDPSKISAWRSTDRDIHGRETLLDRKERKSFRFVFPWAR
jgi:quercetin dioxygenase-like cupin family protein